MRTVRRCPSRNTTARYTLAAKGKRSFAEMVDNEHQTDETDGFEAMSCCATLRFMFDACADGMVV